MTPLAYGWAKVIDKMGFTQEVDHFFDCLSNDKEPLTSGADAYKTQELMHRILTTAGLPRFWNEVSGLFKIAGHHGNTRIHFCPKLWNFSTILVWMAQRSWSKTVIAAPSRSRQIWTN